MLTVKKQLVKNNSWLLGEAHCSKPSLKRAPGGEANLRDTLKDLLFHREARPEPPGKQGTSAISLAICVSGAIFSELMSMLDF